MGADDNDSMTDAPIAHEPVHTAPDDTAQAPAHPAHHGIVALDHLGLIRAWAATRPRVFCTASSPTT